MLHFKRKIRVEIYDTTVYVSFTDDLIGVSNKILLKTKFPLLENECHGIFLTCPQYYQLVFQLENLSVNTIAHECVHAAMQILSEVNIPITTENDEPLAYLLGYLVEKVLYQANKLGIKVNNGSSTKHKD